MPVVTDYTALLDDTGESNTTRWNAQAALGTQTVITYSFTETSDLPTTYQYSATGYSSYTATQRTHFREVIAKYEAIAGVKFVEVQGESMINVYQSIGATVGGWANLPYTSPSYGTHNQGKLVNNYAAMDEYDYGYQVNLHELGHAVGLEHPHEGPFTLDPSVDTQPNTVMTYNIQSPYVIELGVFDIQALQHLYGDADQFDGWKVNVNIADRVTIKATTDAETILGTDQNTRIFAYAGDDTIIGGGADDTLNGGTGADTIRGGFGNDHINGSAGDDIIMGDTDDSDSSYGGDEDNDTLLGAKGRDMLYGGRGDDDLRGGGGRDELYGGHDNDTLDGGGGKDELYGSFGDDNMSGGGGNDILQGDDGDDVYNGGAGKDVFVFVNNDAYDNNSITDFTKGDDKMDMSDFDWMQFNYLTITQSGGSTMIEYSNWIDIELTGYTGTLDATDFIFA